MRCVEVCGGCAASLGFVTMFSLVWGCGKVEVVVSWGFTKGSLGDWGS